ncbi:hypothetical protein N7520_002512 [Penicillium odoratum]|uniref:uncharacterized protein n=1 Tax=Penicillium odoratum TaxID=1167516 RepID=UPI002547231E|nr:uncharacterized protein N7520_002512 [Penicillium odoratum]KAJ5771983.1 hypothetical protein N7520_002512 [Penicillium odoratum]
MACAIADSRVSFFPKADGVILRSTNVIAPVDRPQTIGPILDRENFDHPIKSWSPDIKNTFYPKSEADQPSVIPQKPPEFTDRYLRAFLAEQERLRLSVLWYYTRDILQEHEFLAGLQEKVQLATESTGWEYAVAGFLDINVYHRLATVGLPLGILPRGETICGHAVTQPPGSVFFLPKMVEDWRFQECPMLVKTGLCAYAGVPLRFKTESGHTVGLGTFCVASSKSEEALTEPQHRALINLGDWVVSDLVQCTRARRQRERQRMFELLTKAQDDTKRAVSTEPVFDILRSVYPDAIVRLQPSRVDQVEFEGCDSIPVSEIKGGLWENVEYLDDFIANSNHLPLPSDKPARILAASYDSISGSSLLIVATKDFRLVFDDADAWFVQGCADILSQMWRKALLAEALIAKEKFLRAFSHQLRTPVHGILGAVELLAEEFNSPNMSTGSFPVSAKEQSIFKLETKSHDPTTYINMIKMAGRDLASIINNLIALNKWSDIAIAERHYAMHTLDELETEIGNEIAKVIIGDGRYTCSFFFTQNVPVGCSKFCTDMCVLRDTLLPLVINAIQSTPQGIASANVSIHPDRKLLVIDIEDTGKGIHSDDHRRIFEPYEKVDPHWAGAGLGLTLASKFASLIHGSVELVSSAIGRGSHFRATFHEVQFEFLSHLPQSLALKLDGLPLQFYKMTAGSGSLLLGDRFASFLIRNGFTRSEKKQNSLLIVEGDLDIETRACLAQIPSDQVAFCLVSISGETHYHRETDKNIIYVDGPFLTSTFHSALEKARSYLRAYASQTRQLESHNTDPSTITPLSISRVTIADESTEPDPTNVMSNHLTLDSSLPLTSQPNFIVSIDLKIPTTSTSLSRPSQRPVVLIVDDNAVNLRVMETYCSKRGLPYLSAMHGRQAVDIFTKHQKQVSEDSDSESPIQLIFMDLQMPICGGIEATQQIRALENLNNWKQSFVFVMTGQDSAADRNAAEHAGADEYFVKPVVIKQLDRVLKQCFPDFGGN